MNNSFTRKHFEKEGKLTNPKLILSVLYDDAFLDHCYLSP